MQLIVALHKTSRTLHQSRLKPLSRVVDGVVRLLFAASLPGRAVVGEDVFFHHSGLGVVINPASVIEDGCEIGVHVVLGGRTPLPGAPHLERDVIVHAGAKLIGPIRIGEGCVVAANSVVIDNMPAHSLVAGIPAVAKKREIDNSGYRHLHGRDPAATA